jgi:hypothetical protein
MRRAHEILRRQRIHLRLHKPKKQLTQKEKQMKEHAKKRAHKLCPLLPVGGVLLKSFNHEAFNIISTA